MPAIYYQGNGHAAFQMVGPTRGFSILQIGLVRGAASDEAWTMNACCRGQSNWTCSRSDGSGNQWFVRALHRAGQGAAIIEAHRVHACRLLDRHVQLSREWPDLLEVYPGHARTRQHHLWQLILAISLQPRCKAETRQIQTTRLKDCMCAPRPRLVSQQLQLHAPQLMVNLLAMGSNILLHTNRLDPTKH